MNNEERARFEQEFPVPRNVWWNPEWCGEGRYEWVNVLLQDDSPENAHIQQQRWIGWQAAEMLNATAQPPSAAVPEGWRDVRIHGLPEEACELWFVIQAPPSRVVHGAFIDGIFWHSNKKYVALFYMPKPAHPELIRAAAPPKQEQEA